MIRTPKVVRRSPETSRRSRTTPSTRARSWRRSGVGTWRRSPPTGSRSAAWCSYVDDASAGRSCASRRWRSTRSTPSATRGPACSSPTPVPDGDDPLAAARVTLVGTLVPFDVGIRTDFRDAYLAAHPGAAFYVDFPDFSWWHLEPSAVRYVGGFGHMSWVVPTSTPAGPDPIAPSAEAIRTHLDEDHADVLLDYAKAYAGLTDANGGAHVGRRPLWRHAVGHHAGRRPDGAGSHSTSRRRPSTTSARRR